MSHRHGDSTASASLIPDADSDLDLDLDELDPQTTTSNSRNHSSANGHSSRNIPLKNLRLGGRRAFRRPDRYVDDADAEDLEALVGRDSQAHERHSHTDHPSPSHTSRLRRLSDKSQSALAKFRARLNPFSRSAPLDNDDDDDDDDDEPEDEHDSASNRSIVVGSRQDAKYPPNAVSNAKYTPVSFLPRTLYNEFSFFFNLYFLLVALSQIIPQLRIGYLSTYIFPLLFVLTITLGKEAMDDIHRRKRDQEANSERYTVLQFGDNDTTSPRRRQPTDQDADGLLDSEVREITKPSRLLKVGDVLVMTKDQRFPADVVILKSFSQESSAQPEPLPESEEANL
ncbi:phospholipid-translocating P-type ATPase-like protein, partial [Aureobasidium melanogenum]